MVVVRPRTTEFVQLRLKARSRNASYNQAAGSLPRQREGGYSEIELETISQDTHTVDIAPLWMPLVVDVENDIAVIKEKSTIYASTPDHAYRLEYSPAALCTRARSQLPSSTRSTRSASRMASTTR